MEQHTLPASERSVFDHIQELVEEEHRLFSKGTHGPAEEADLQRLSKLQVELDQCWDLLRRRRALLSVPFLPSFVTKFTTAFRICS